MTRSRPSGSVLGRCRVRSAKRSTTPSPILQRHGCVLCTDGASSARSTAPTNVSCLTEPLGADPDVLTLELCVRGLDPDQGRKSLLHGRWARQRVDTRLAPRGGREAASDTEATWPPAGTAPRPS